MSLSSATMKLLFNDQGAVLATITELAACSRRHISASALLSEHSVGKDFTAETLWGRKRRES
jgi:hypothetical protein